MRIAETEIHELKDSLRYVEIQLAKSKEETATAMHKHAASQAEVAKCHDQIAR